MGEDKKLSNSKLIELLQEEMISDVKKINITSENENKIDLPLVYTWYIETEKLIRVIGNLFTTPLSQAINQLRYAGHHILKSSVSDDEIVKKQNIVEAYKHCKRAYYDAFDFYVYKLSEDYRVLLPYLESQSASKLERILREHLQEIQEGRLESKERIEYYSGIQKTVIKGLEIIESLNELQRETGISRKLYIGKQSLLEENSSLEKKIDILQTENKVLDGEINSRSTGVAIAITLILAVGTVFGLIADAFMPSYHEITYNE